MAPLARAECGVELSGKVVVVPVEWAHAAGLAQQLGVQGATVVLVGSDAEEAGRLAASFEATGAGRPAVFLVDGSADSFDALAAFVAEMFRDR